VDGVHDLRLPEEHRIGGRSEGDEAVGAGDSGHPALVATVDQGREDALGDATAVPRLVDDQDRRELAGDREHRLDG
jgi:hypothetical protein